MKRLLTVILFAFAACCMAQQAQLRIDLDARPGQVPLTPEKSPGLNVVNPGWMGEKKAYYLTVNGGKVTSKWTAQEFSFTPEKDGTVKLVLMGADNKDQIWVAYDNLTITGAELKNPDFEEITPRFANWSCYRESLLDDQNDAQSGRNYVKAWCGKTVWQIFDVKKGQKVTVKFYVRDENGEPSAVSTAKSAADSSKKVLSKEKVTLPKPSDQPAPLPERESAAWNQAPEEKVSPLRSVICLDGWWKFAPLTEQKNISWGYIRVPGSWASSQGWEYYANLSREQGISGRNGMETPHKIITWHFMSGQSIFPNPGADARSFSISSGCQLMQKCM